MMFGNPFFADYEDGDYYFEPRRGYYSSQARRQAELEARRREEAERYFQQQRRREEERRRLEYARRYRRQQELEEYARRRQRQQELEEEAYEAELRRHHRARESAEERRLRSLRLNPSYYGSSQETDDSSSSSEEEEEEQRQYRLVRGMDGNIYRVPVRAAARKEMKSSTPLDSSHKTTKTQRGSGFSRNTQNKFSHDSLRELESDNESEDDEDTYRTATTPKSNPLRATTTASPHSQHKRSLRHRNSSKKSKRVTIIVEDASDSETEDDYQSPWRNRRPSPGQWIEPVEGVNMFA